MAMAFNFTKIELFASYKWQRDLKAFVINFCENLNLGTVSITRGSGVYTEAPPLRMRGKSHLNAVHKIFEHFLVGLRLTLKSHLLILETSTNDNRAWSEVIVGVWEWGGWVAGHGWTHGAQWLPITG